MNATKADDLEPLAIGRVDAAIHRPDDLLTVLEVKVGVNELNRPQLDRHAANWNIPRTARKVVRWSDVHNWVERELAEESSGSITSFLLTQFLAFLDLTELAPFRGFRDEDFDFFNSPVPELRPIVKNRLAGLGEKVFALLTDSEREAIGEVHVGQIGEGADHAWLDTQHRQDVVNLTIELYEHELQVNLVGWRRDQARQFERWLLSDDALLRLPKLVSHDFVVYERSAYNIGRKGTGARPWWQKEHIKKVAWRPAPQISRAWIEEMLGEFDDRSWRKPGFHIRRSFPRSAVVAARETMVGEVAEEVRTLLPLLEHINAS